MFTGAFFICNPLNDVLHFDHCKSTIRPTISTKKFFGIFLVYQIRLCWFFGNTLSKEITKLKKIEVKQFINRLDKQHLAVSAHEVVSTILY